MHWSIQSFNILATPPVFELFKIGPFKCPPHQAKIAFKCPTQVLGSTFELKDSLCDQWMLKISKVMYLQGLVLLLGFSLASIIPQSEKFMILGAFSNCNTFKWIIFKLFERDCCTFYSFCSFTIQ